MPPEKIIDINYSEAAVFRLPLEVSEIFIMRNGSAFPVCPRCKVTLEREYQSYCDRCGQRLDWKNFGRANIINTFM